jgi:8-oxo-dGTP diphosphatase
LKTISVCAGVIIKEGMVLLAKRPKGSNHAGKWEFPGGKRDGTESLWDCMKRELFEELGITVQVKRFILSHEVKEEDRHITLEFFLCGVGETQPISKEGQEFGWFPLDAVGNLELAPPDKEVLNKIIEEVKRYV